jgi:hypothetical protein
VWAAPACVAASTSIADHRAPQHAPAAAVAPAIPSDRRHKRSNWTEPSELIAPSQKSAARHSEVLTTSAGPPLPPAGGAAAPSRCPPAVTSGRRRFVQLRRRCSTRRRGSHTHRAIRHRRGIADLAERGESHASKHFRTRPRSAESGRVAGHARSRHKPAHLVSRCSPRPNRYIVPTAVTLSRHTKGGMAWIGFLHRS